MKKVAKYNALRITAIVLLFIVSLNALTAGNSFITDPSGSGLGISTDYLRQAAPFNNYLIPGIVLFTLIGVVSCLIAILAIVKQRHYQFMILMQGCILVGWIVRQLLTVTAFHPLHFIIALIGATLILLGWLINQNRKTG